MRSKLYLVPLLIILSMTVGSARAGDVTVSWNPNPESDLSGYNIYYSTESQSTNTEFINAGNVTAYEITGLQDGVTYFFRVTAYDFSGNESNFSDEVSIRVSGSGSTVNRPELVTLSPNGPTQIDLIFSEAVEKTSAENTANYAISNGIQVMAAIQDQDAANIVHLLTSQHQPGVTYTLTISGVTDLDGNAILDGTSKTYQVTEAVTDTEPPSLIYVAVLNDTEIDLVFSEALLKDLAENTANYSIDNGIQVLQAQQLTTASIVRLTTSSHSQGITYTASVSGLEDLAGNIVEPGNAISYQIQAGDPAPELTTVRVQGATQIDVHFSEPVDLTDASFTVNNGIEVKAWIPAETRSIVHLLTSQHIAGDYTLTVNGVRDLAGNVIAANSRINYSINEAVETTPVTFSLFPNYPNPFNPETEIRFFLDQNREVELKVYNTRGQLVRSLVDNQMPTGYHTVVWDGTNKRGVPMPSGVYIYSLEVKRDVVKDDLLVSVSVERRVRRMTLVR